MRKTFDRLVPEFTEADVFFLAFTILATALLYGGSGLFFAFILNLIGSFFQINTDNPAGWVIGHVAILYFIYVFIISLYYPLSKKVPGRLGAANMVLWALIFVSGLSIYNGYYWLMQLFADPLGFDLVILIFPLLGLIQGFIILILIRYGGINYDEKFEYENAHRNQILIGSVIILFVIMLGFLSDFNVPLLMLIAAESSTWGVKILTGLFPAWFKAASSPKQKTYRPLEIPKKPPTITFKNQRRK